jgi:hypothetical protein
MKRKTKRIKPFANESDSLSIGGLTIENRVDRIALYGSVDITLDSEGQVFAESLKTLFDDILIAMQDRHLPPKISTNPTDTIPNPFSTDG